MRNANSIMEVPDYVTRELNDFDKAFQNHNPLQRIRPSWEIYSDSSNDIADETIIDETCHDSINEPVAEPVPCIAVRNDDDGIVTF